MVRNLHAGWQESKPVCKISELRVNRKEITVLCGPNGAGKSTLLKTIASQIAPISGEIFFDGTDKSQLTRKQIAQRLAFVAQFTDTRRLTVEEWVSLGRNPHQQWWSWASSKTDREKIELALERTDCASLRGKMIDTLSGGERQRVLIATALAQEPAYMLLDEPTSHLDFRHQLELIDLLEQLKNEGLGILVVLHDLNLSARIADQVILINKENDSISEIKAAGKVEDVFTPETLRKVYGVEMEILSNADGTKTCYVASGLSEESAQNKPQS